MAPFTFSRLLRYAVQGVVLGLLVTAVIVLVTTDADTWRGLRAFPFILLPWMLLMVVVAWACAGTRIGIVSGAMGYRLAWRDAFAVGLASEFGVAASPAGIGGAAVRLAYLHRGGVPMDACFTIFAADSVLDMLFFLLLSPLALVYVMRDADWRHLLTGAFSLPPVVWIALGGLVLGLVLAVVHRNRLQRRVERFCARHGWSKRWRMAARVRHFRHVVDRLFENALRGLHFLLHARRSALFGSLALAGMQWCCSYGILPLILYGFGAVRNPLPLLVVQGFFFALALVMVLPGGGGGIELLTTGILRFFLPVSMVGIVVLMWRFFTYHLYLLGGGIAFALTFDKRMSIGVVEGGHASLIRAHRGRRQ